MTTPNIEGLRKLAEAATPGQWHITKSGDSHWMREVRDIDGQSVAFCGGEIKQSHKDAEYIATANPAKVIELLDALQSQAERIKELEASMMPLSADYVQWVVNNNAELGVKIGEQFFFLYKGESLVYLDAKHDDGTPMMWRSVGKREFGECCYPVKFYKDGATLPERYRDELTFIPGLSFGKKEDSDWKELPASPKIGGV